MDLNDLKQLLPGVFEKVKEDVRKITNRHRAGFSLRLAKMGRLPGGGFIAGMHYYPGPDIIINLSPLEIILKNKPDEIIWAYTYHILLHEYIHSLGIGIDNEEDCQINTLYISEQIFKDKNHWVIKIAKYGIGVAIDDIEIKTDEHDWRPDSKSIEYVDDFDRDSQSLYS